MRSTTIIALVTLAALLAACGNTAPAPAVAPPPPPPPAPAVPLDPNNIASIAIGSKDHTTLVAALQAADYVRAVSNAGPLTVFAPTNAAFAKLPPGTVETLVKPENQEKLQGILKYHVTTSVYTTADLKDGQELSMANGKKATIHLKDGVIRINDATVSASVRGSNGIVHIVDSVLLPPG